MKLLELNESGKSDLIRLDTEKSEKDRYGFLLSRIGRKDRNSKEYEFILLSDILIFLKNNNRKVFLNTISVIKSYLKDRKVIPLIIDLIKSDKLSYSITLKVVVNLEKDKINLLITDLIDIINYLLIGYRVVEFYESYGFIKDDLNY